MIELYTAATGNGRRAAIMAAECGLPYRVRRLDMAAGENRAPWYLAINPAGLIPAIVDTDGPGGQPLALAQSGAIVLYLAEKTGRFLPTEPLERARVLQWFMHVCSDIAGTNATLTLGATRVAEPSKPTLDHFEALLLRDLRLIDAQLAERPCLAGDRVSIADLALVPHVVRRQALVSAAGLSHLQAWLQRMEERPGVAEGMRRVETAAG